MLQKKDSSNTPVVPRGIILSIPDEIGIFRFFSWIIWVLHRYRLPYIFILVALFVGVSLSTETPIKSMFECFCIFEGVMLTFAAHETSHWGVAVKRYGIKAEYLAIVPYNFALSVNFKEDENKLDIKQRARIYIAGPVIPMMFFFVIGLICLLITVTIRDFTYTKLPIFICADGIFINLFSLLPIPGTDWSRVKSYYLSKNVLGGFFNKINRFTRKANEFFIYIMTNH